MYRVIYSLKNTSQHRTKVFCKQKLTSADWKPKNEIWLLTENEFVHQSSYSLSPIYVAEYNISTWFSPKGHNLPICGRWRMCLRFVWSLLTLMHPNVHPSGVPQLHTPAPPSKSEIGPKSEHDGFGNCAQKIVLSGVGFEPTLSHENQSLNLAP